jgi:hypothetical protein
MKQPLAAAALLGLVLSGQPPPSAPFSNPCLITVRIRTSSLDGHATGAEPNRDG